MKNLGFGLMRLPLNTPDNPGDIDIEQFKKMVDEFIENGFTYFDTAWMYCDGKSENAVKEALVSRYPRDSFTLTTKLPAYMLKKESDMDWLFNEQLNKTGAGFFDYYWLHDVNSDTVRTFDSLNAWEFIRKKKEAGLVRHIGFSYHDGPELLDKLLTEHPEIEYVQIQLNYLDWDSLGIQSRKCYEVITNHGKPVIVMEPVKGGTLAKLPPEASKLLKNAQPKMSLASWAVRFAASHKNVMMVLSGMSNLEQLRDNMSYMKDFTPLNKEEIALVLQVGDIIRRNVAIPCTGCSYCTVNCPQGIPIPTYFSLYNTEMLEDPAKGWCPQGGYYQRLTLSHSKASECLKCGQCEKMCPQHLHIRDFLVKVADRFE